MRIRPTIVVIAIALALIGAGGVIIGASGGGVGSILLAAGVVLGLLAVAPGYSAEGRSAKDRGIDGFRPEPHGFDRPRDESRLL